MDAPVHSESSSPSPHLSASQSKPQPRNIDTQQRPSFSRQQRPPHQSLFDREREPSAGGWSASSVGTGVSSSVNRKLSRRLVGGRPSGLKSNLRKKRDKHSLALLSIREFLKGRSCYDCLPVSFRLVVLDTKLVVKPALDVMWQAGIVSAPLWQSTSQSQPALEASSSSSLSGPTEEAFSPSALSAKLAATELVEASPNRIPPYRPNQGLGLEGNNDNNFNNSTVDDSSSAAATAASNAKAGATGPPAGKAGFAGMLTVNDIIHLIQYYYHHSSYDNAAQDVERFRLEMLREIEQTLHVPQPPLISIEPLRPLFDACKLLIETHARRLPLLDYDEQTGMEAVVSVLTQYRVLKFIAMNCRETAGLNRTLRSLGIGTYVAGTRGVGASSGLNHTTATSARGSVASSSRRSSNAATSSFLSPSTAPTSGLVAEESTTSLGSGAVDMLPPLEEGISVNSPAFEPPPPHFFPDRTSETKYDPIATATLDTTVFDVVHVFSEKGISAIPILDEEGFVVDMYETVDVIDLVRSGAYQSLDLTIRQALSKRSKDFPGVMTCGPDDTLATIFTLLRTKRVHRLLILEPEVVQEGELDPFEISESSTTTAASAQQSQEKVNDPLAGLGEIKQRKRGKLVGILCLSDVLRYVIGGKAILSDPSAAALVSATNASTSGSAMGDADIGNTEAEEKEIPSPEGATQTSQPEGGPRPIDMPPTIAEHPKEQQSMNENVVDQQEK